MQLNWSLGISLYMLAGGLITDYKVQKKLKDKEEIEKLYDDYPSILVDMLQNRALVFAMGCFVGLPGFLLGLKERIIDKK